MVGRVAGWLERHDPGRYALARGGRTAIVVTVVLAVCQILDLPSQTTLFGVFGSFAFLLFADLPGDRDARLAGYLGLAIAGAILIVVGAACYRPPWLAVASMAVIGFLIVFAGTVSAAAAACTRAALLAFVLSLTVPAPFSQVWLRLGGWAIAALVCIPAALLLWPPAYHDDLRVKVAAVCRSIAALLRSSSASADEVESSKAAVRSLREVYRRTETRPVGLSTGSRYLIRVIEGLEWLRSVVCETQASPPSLSPDRSADLRRLLGQVLGAGAEVVDPATTDRPVARNRLDRALADFEEQRAGVARATLTAVAALAHTDSDLAARPLLADRHWHVIDDATATVGYTIAVAAAADARPVWARLLGRPVPASGLAPVAGRVSAAARIVRGQLHATALGFRNAVRMALGLTLAVLAVELTDVQHSFWVALGAMSVLRSTAIVTGSTVVRAMVGTVVGVIIGAGIVYLVGVEPERLWPLLPIAVFLAAFAPGALSFATGQAAFTVVVLILFNILQPTGWTVGIWRFTDIAIGCLSGLVAGALAWPRGAGGALRLSLVGAYQAVAVDLRAAVRGIEKLDEPAKQAQTRLDAALRGYLAEHGKRSMSLEAVTFLVNGGTRARLAADSIATLVAATPASNLTATEAGRSARQLLTRHGDDLATGFDTLADRLGQRTPVDVAWRPRPSGTPPAAGSPEDARRDENVAAAAAPGDAVALLWAEFYLDDLDTLLAELGSQLTIGAESAPTRPQ